MGNGLFHHFGGLQHERQNQLAGAELIAHFFHRWQQNIIEDAHRVARLERFIDFCFDAVFAPPENRVVDAHFDGRAGIIVFCVLRRTLRDVLIPFDQPLQRIGPAIEDRVVTEFALLGIDFGVGRDLFRVHQRHVETGLHAVMEKHGAELRALAV